MCFAPGRPQQMEVMPSGEHMRQEIKKEILPFHAAAAVKFKPAL